MMFTLSDDASDFVLLSEAVPDAILEIRYYSTYNFVGERIDGYEEPLAMLTTGSSRSMRSGGTLHWKKSPIRTPTLRSRSTAT